MLYLVDANIPIDANMYYYPLARVPQFWDWLAAMGRQGIIKIPREIFEEVALPRPEDPDAVIGWMLEHQADLLLDEEPTPGLVARVVEEGYANDLTDIELGKIGRDPFLIAYALADTANRRVVSNEASRPTQRRANRKVPDVCAALGVRCLNIFSLIRELDFRTTDWQSRP